jgi:hypothetical protein
VAEDAEHAALVVEAVVVLPLSREVDVRRRGRIEYDESALGDLHSAART